MITLVDRCPAQGMTLFTCPCASASLTAKRMSHGVQPWPVVRVRAVGTSQGVVVDFKTCVGCNNDFTGPGLLCWRCVGLGIVLARAEQAVGRRSLRRPSEGRAQRGLNLLKEHITTGTCKGQSVEAYR